MADADRETALLHAVTPYGPRTGSSRVRVHDWVARLPDAVIVHPYAGLDGARPGTLIRNPGRVARAERDLRALAASRPTRLLLHREASPLSRGGLERRLLLAASVSVYDFDDALYLDTGSGPLYRRLAPKAAKATAALQVVDRVVAGNDTLAEWASARHRDVVVIPSCVDPSSYRRKTDFVVGAPPRLGWIGSWSTERYLRGIADPLMHLHERLGARLVLIGSASGHLGRLEQMVDRVPWSPRAQHEGLAGFDVGLMPLPDDPYARGKCAYKLLQYLAAAVPSVASPVGVNRQVLEQSGIPAATTAVEWVDAVTRLLELPEGDRRALGDRGRRLVEEQYSFDAWRERWRAAMHLGA